MKGMLVLALVVVCGESIRTFPQAQPGAVEAQPSRLRYFVGRWDFEQEIAGAMYTKSETCELFAGGHHLICESQGTSPLGPYRGHAVISYDATESTFTRHTVTSQGISSFMRGIIRGQTWTADTEFKLNGRLVKAQVVWTEQSPTSQAFKMLGSIDGGPPLVLEHATGKKVQ